MGQIKGQKEWNAHKQGKELTRKQAILALCYECNGFEESAKPPCVAVSCPIWPLRWKKRVASVKPRKTSGFNIGQWNANKRKGVS